MALTASTANVKTALLKLADRFIRYSSASAPEPSSSRMQDVNRIGHQRAEG